MGDMGGTVKTPVGAILAIAGGAMLGIGSFLAWAEVSGGGTSVSAKGIDGTDGYITLGAGVVALLVGVVCCDRPSERSRSWRSSQGSSAEGSRSMTR